MRPMCAQDPYYIGCEESTLSEVAIPLHVEGQLVGVFTASHTELDAFSPCQLRLLQAMCSDVAVAVHNARRFQQEQRQREQMSGEAREARLIQQALSPKELSLYSWIYRFRTFHSRRRRRRRLVRLHFHGQRPLGAGAGRRFRQGNRRRAAHVRHSRHLAITGRG